MTSSIQYRLNEASELEIRRHLLECDPDFVPALSSRVDIASYAHRISTKATRFEAWHEDSLVGLVAAYCNDADSRIAYVTSVSVLRGWMGRGIASQMMTRCLEHARASAMTAVKLEVAQANAAAIRLYEDKGFVADQASPPFVTMTLYLSDWGTR
jgi:ribosomal protein S18 acetylase RimI-like enzyme